MSDSISHAPFDGLLPHPHLRDCGEHVRPGPDARRVRDAGRELAARLAVEPALPELAARLVAEPVPPGLAVRLVEELVPLGLAAPEFDRHAEPAPPVVENFPPRERRRGERSLVPESFAHGLHRHSEESDPSRVWHSSPRPESGPPVPVPHLRDSADVQSRSDESRPGEMRLHCVDRWVREPSKRRAGWEPLPLSGTHVRDQ